MPTPSLSDEVTYMTGVDAGGTIVGTSFRSWDGKSPAGYTVNPTSAAKWGTSTAGTGGGTVNYTFDTAWSATEKDEFRSVLAFYSAVANITFNEVPSLGSKAAGITIKKTANGGASAGGSLSGTSGAGTVGGTTLWNENQISIDIDPTGSGFGPIDGTFTTAGGYPWMTIFHEVGHAVGLGHSGPYNEGDGIDPASVQYSPYDSNLYTVMSYNNPTTTTTAYYSQYPVTGTNWGVVRVPQGGGSFQIWGKNPVTLMPLDILALQRLYGTPSGTTTLTVGHTFGFNTDIGASDSLRKFYDFTVNTEPVVTIWDSATNNTLDLSGFSSATNVNLNPGTYSSAGTSSASNGSIVNMVNNIAIAYNTWIDSFKGSVGADTVLGNAHANTIKGGLGNDVIDGGSDVDTAVFTGARVAYAISQPSTGHFTIIGPDGADTLANVEYAKFDDQTVRLLPGSGTSVDFNAAPATYMAAIRDFDGNNLTGQGTQVIDPNTGGLVAGPAWDGSSGWTLAGTADVSGSGLQSRILFNNLIGRWAEVTTESDGKAYFGNYGWAGDTRVVGIYIDPEVTLGHAVQGGPNDSQRRFQNDLFIGNIKNVLAAGDYNHDGFQEVYFSLTDGTAYLHALMWNDGNIQYANYQSKQQVQDYLTANGYTAATWSSWLQEAPAYPVIVSSGMTPSLVATDSTPMLAGVAV